MTISKSVLDWLLDGDPSIRWQTLRDLADARPKTVETERRKVAGSGWAGRLLSLQDQGGLWAGGLYNPKWKSTAYTMLLLRDLGVPGDDPRIRLACKRLLDNGLHRDGGINYSFSMDCGETCVTGMVLSILSRFGYPDDRVRLLTDYLLKEQMPDGGWNCRRHKGATHSSFHTTINALEGLHEYERRQAKNAGRIAGAQAGAREMFRAHRHFRSHRTGRIVDGKMTRISYPPRWRYDVLRGLDYFQASGVKPDQRDSEAVELILKKRSKDGTWPLQNRHSGKTFFELETVGKPSRWNTLRALRVLKWFEKK
jgi:hypothetical protein